MDANKYGTIAEIGAGQEVARWFFVVGGAAGTIAKSMSAYDMNVSDAIYGSTRRYVSRDRLLTMLDYEYSLLLKRLQDRREETTQFFTFADTVAARSHTRAEAESHAGWASGFSTSPEPSRPTSSCTSACSRRRTSSSRRPSGSWGSTSSMARSTCIIIRTL